MGFFDFLFRRKPSHLTLLRATIWDSGRHEYWVVLEQIHPECRSVEYIRLVAHYYAKVLFNFGSGYDEMGNSARVCIHSMRTLLRHEINQSSNIMELADLADTASVIPSDPRRKGVWSAQAVLYFISSVRRHITTDFPGWGYPGQNTTAQQAVFSLFALVQECLRSLHDPQERRMLIATLRNMQSAYEGGTDWADLQNLALVPMQAYADTVIHKRPAAEEARGVEEVNSRDESGKEDQAFRTIAARIEPLKGLDRRFAARMLQAAWEIIQKFSDIPGADFAERFAAAPSEDAVKAYKAILGQLFFTFFLPDADARKSASQLLTDTTDKDLEDTIRLWVKFEECPKGEDAAADPRFCTAAIAWKSACEAIGADPSAEPVALLCFVSPWDAAMSELRGEFS